MNPLAKIPNEKLTHEFWIKSKDQAKCERDWEIIDHQRLPLLAEITSWYTGESHAAAERKARVSKEYQEFLTKRADTKEKLVLARARTKSLDLEIRLRLNKSFTDRAEFKAGSLNT